MSDYGMDQNEAERQNALEIDRLTTDFEGFAIDAVNYARETREVVERLISDQVYDVEMVGTQAADALAELATAERALRNVQRIARHRRSLMSEG